MAEIGPSRTVNLTAEEASAWIARELRKARDALRASDLDAALGTYVPALGLALQLGPAPTEQVLAAVLEAARDLAEDRRGPALLSALGPALVNLADQVRVTHALPATAIMNAWATVVADIGALLGQIGLALSIPAPSRSGLLENARAHAALLDEATHNLFSLGQWLDAMRLDN
jgi:hypothetical protein